MADGHSARLAAQHQRLNRRATGHEDDAALHSSCRKVRDMGLQLRETLGTFNAELAEEFWRAVSSAGALTLHVVLHHGRNAHHIVEGVFKATARALRQAAELGLRR